ncbi:odorant receptor 22a-like [Harmonia axyridis]|uniref:odorant receptor 22a-like n=1 Tax=Harmonia axyridis TaxID=115357 RepID=UPI001E279ABF|nr:odorant receptor 22a-like [Harmonia axyridis]
MGGALMCNLLLSLFLYLKNRGAEPAIEKPFTLNNYWMPFDEQKYHLMGHIYTNVVCTSVGLIVVSGDFFVLAPVLYLNCRIKTLKFVLRNPSLFLDKNDPSRENYYNLSETVSDVVNILPLACGTFVFFQLFIVYWHGQILIEESGSISSAIFQGDWDEADQKTKKILITMMTRSVQPLSLTVGPLFVVNLELFLKITKSVYTITTLFF